MESSIEDSISPVEPTVVSEDVNSITEDQAYKVFNKFNQDMQLKEFMEDGQIVDPDFANAFSAMFPGKEPSKYADSLLSDLMALHMQDRNHQNNLEKTLGDEDSIEPVSGTEKAEDQKSINNEQSPTNDNSENKQRKLLNGIFVERENNAFFRIDGKSPALLDEGKKLKIVKKDIETFQAAIELAHAKGWTAIQVKGSERFRSEAWYQASLRGVQVQGYTPTEKDLKRLSEHQAEQQLSKEEQEGFKSSLESAENFALEQDGAVVYPDSVSENRQFSGKVVAVTDKHIVQDIGRNTYAIHEKSKLGDVSKGERLDLKYKGRDVAITKPQIKEKTNTITR